MQTRINYDHERLKRLVRSTGLSDEQVAARVGLQRLQVTRVLNNIQASILSIERLVKMANEELGRHAAAVGEEYKPVNWRAFLLDNVTCQENASPQKILAEIVS